MMAMADRILQLDELYDAVVNGVAPSHSGEWAMATLEICLAVLQSAREGKSVGLEHQVGFLRQRTEVAP